MTKIEISGNFQQNDKFFQIFEKKSFFFRKIWTKIGNFRKKSRNFSEILIENQIVRRFFFFFENFD